MSLIQKKGNWKVTHACFECELSNNMIASLRVHSEGKKYTIDIDFRKSGGWSSICGETHGLGSLGRDASTDRSYTTPVDALIQGARSVAYQVNNANVRFNEPWRQTSCSIQQLDDNGLPIRDGHADKIPYEPNDVMLDISLPQSEGVLKPRAGEYLHEDTAQAALIKFKAGE